MFLLTYAHYLHMHFMKIYNMQIYILLFFKYIPWNIPKTFTHFSNGQLLGLVVDINIAVFAITLTCIQHYREDDLKKSCSNFRCY
jgi:hypothetical protein